MKLKALMSLIVPGILLTGTQSDAQTEFKDLQRYSRTLGFERWYQPREYVRPLKIAILDENFDGYESEVGRGLPPHTQYHPGPLSVSAQAKGSGHGMIMAQIMYQLMTNEGRDFSYEPAEFHLYNTSGYTNFTYAIEDAVQRDIDIIIYATVWLVGSNWQGGGFINKQVDKAIDNGIIWVNAAGNYSTRTFQSRIRHASSGPDAEAKWLALPDRNNAVEIKCQPSQMQDKCPLRATLVWNDFKSSPDWGTDKDLDLALTDDVLNIIASSTLIQVLENPDEREDYSLYPREALVVTLDPGTYYLRVKDQSQNFSQDDELRIAIEGDHVSMTSGQSDNTIFNPGDNERVITVGAYDSELSSTARYLGKPDLFAPSKITVEGENVPYFGSSSATAITAAGLAMILSANPKLTREQLIKAVTRGLPELVQFSELPEPRVTEASPQGFIQKIQLEGGDVLSRTPCLTRGATPPPWVRAFIAQYGGQFVNGPGRPPAVIVNFDPINLAMGLGGPIPGPGDLLMIAPHGGLILVPGAMTAPPEAVAVLPGAVLGGNCPGEMEQPQLRVQVSERAKGERRSFLMPDPFYTAERPRREAPRAEKPRPVWPQPEPIPLK